MCIKTLFLFSKALKWEGEDQYCSDERRFSFNRNLSQYYYLHTSMFTCVERLIFCVDLYTYIRFETIDVLRKQYVSKISIQDSNTQYRYYINLHIAISRIAYRFINPHMCENWQSNLQSIARRYYFSLQLIRNLHPVKILTMKYFRCQSEASTNDAVFCKFQFCW